MQGEKNLINERKENRGGKNMNMNGIMNLLNDEQKKKLDACGTEEERKAFLRGIPISLDEDELENVTGGRDFGQDIMIKDFVIGDKKPTA